MKIRKSIDHFTGKEQNALLHIRKTVVDTLKPELLFFLSSHALTSLSRDYLVKDLRTENFHLSCTLLAIVPEKQDEGLISELENQLLSFGKVNLIVYPMERFVQELQNKTFFIPTIYRHALLLFEHPKGHFRSVLDSVYRESQQKQASNKHLPDGESVNSLHPLFSYVFYPHCLTQQEADDPFVVLYNFFQMMHLPTAKQEITVWMEAIRNGLVGKRHEAANLLTFYESLNKLIHAAFIIRKLDHNRPANLTGVLEPDKDYLPEAQRKHSTNCVLS